MKFGFGSSTEKNGVPRIEAVTPTAAIPGGEMVIRGSGLAQRVGPRPSVQFGEVEAGLMLVTENRVIVRVPDGASDGTVRVTNGNGESTPHPVSIGVQIADNLHPIGNPAVDLEGNIYVTFSGPRGEPVPVSLYKVTANYSVKPFVTSLINPSGLALDRWSNLYVAASHAGRRGIVRITPDAKADVILSGSGLVGLALLPSGRAILTTNSALFTLDWDVRGLPLFG